MQYFRFYCLLGVILFGFFSQNRMSYGQEPLPICDRQFWKTALPSDVILELELSGVDANYLCDEETGDRIIHIALLRSHNRLAIKVLITAGASLLVENYIEETPVILVEKMHFYAESLLRWTTHIDESVTSIQSEYEFLGHLLNELRRMEREEKRRKGLL